MGRWIRRSMALALVAGLVWLGFWLFPLSFPEGETRLSVLSWNVHGFHGADTRDTRALILDGLATAGADVLVLQEFPVGRWGSLIQEELKALGYPHSAHFTYDHSVTNSYAMGLAIYSRHPITRWKESPLQPQSEGRLLALAEIEVEGRLLRVGGVHMPNSDIHLRGKRAMVASELFGENLRTIQAASLLEELRPYHDGPLVLAGDFNTFPMSSAWRMVRGQYRDAFPVSEWAQGTFSIRENLEVKIDHVFHSRKVRSLGARVMRLGGSDHLPVMAELQF